MEVFLKKHVFFKYLLKFITYGLLSFFSYLMILITLQYIPINFKVAFLAVKEEEIKLLHYQVSFYTHVYTSIFVLVCGFFQFSTQIRRLYSFIHKTIGKLYIYLILFCAAPSGLIMGYYGNGGIYSQISFCLLAILWFYFTLMALIKIGYKKFEAHRNYMILSYSLTLSAISLRLFKWFIANTFELPPMDTYQIVVWAGWLFNLGIAALIIKFKTQSNSIQNFLTLSRF